MIVHFDALRPLITAMRKHCLILLLIYFLASSSVVARTTHTIYWNATNPIFRIDNNKHVIPVHILDQVNFKCPYTNGNEFLDSQVQYSQIYRVSKWSYDTCTLAEDSRVVGVCKRPEHETELSIVIRQFTPIPGGLEFEPGKTYYFISTSSGKEDGLTKRNGGLCLYNNMKLKFEVLYDEGDPRAYPSDNSDDSNVSIYSHPETTTPLMYIVEELPPDDPYWQQKPGNKPNSAARGYRHPTTGDGGRGSSARNNAALLALSSLLYILFRDVRI